MKSLIASALMVLGLATPAFAQQISIHMDMGGQGGQVSVSPNGMVITFGGNRMYRKRISMNAPGSITIGSQIYTSGGSQGYVAGMNPATQMVSVNISGSIYSLSLNDLAVTDGCDGVFCVGEQTITTGGSNGTIAGFFGDGRVVVNISGSVYTLQATDLALTAACSGYFCTGDNVITSGGSNGSVSGIFYDGRIAVNISGSEYMLNASDLSITQAICANVYINRVGLCR